MSILQILPRQKLGYGLLLLALAARLASTGVWWSDTQTDPDAYVGLANELATGAGLCTPGTRQPTAYRPPAYPLFLSTLVTVDGFQHGLAIPVWNTIFDLATLGFVWSWLRYSSSNVLVPHLAVLLLAIDPLMVRYTPLAMTESCFTCWTTAGVLLLANVVGLPGNSSARLDLGLWGVAGGMLGLAALCRPTIWPFIGLFVVVVIGRGLWKSELSQSRRMFAEVATFLTTVLLLVSPWVIRNALVLGSPVLTTTHGGYTLLLANNPVFYDEVARQPWGTVWSGASLERWQHEMLARMESELGPTATEIEKDRWQSQQAWENIRNDPGGFLAGVWYRVRSLWSLSPRGTGQTLSLATRIVVGGWYACFFVAALSGITMLWQRRSGGLWVLLLFVFSLQAIHLCYWTDTRMRMPIHPLLAIFAAQNLNRLAPARR